MTKATKKALLEDLKSIQLVNDETRELDSREYFRKRIFREKYRDHLIKNNIWFEYKDTRVHSVDVDFKKLLNTVSSSDVIDVIHGDKEKVIFDNIFLYDWLFDELKEIYSAMIYMNINKIIKKYDNIKEFKLYIDKNFFSEIIQSYLFEYFLGIETLLYNHLKSYSSNYFRGSYFNITDALQDNKSLYNMLLKIYDYNNDEVHYNLLMEFVFNNGKKSIFIADPIFEHIRPVTNLNNLFFFESIRQKRYILLDKKKKIKQNKREEVVNTLVRNALKDADPNKIAYVTIENPNLTATYTVYISYGTNSKTGCIEFKLDSYIVRKKIKDYLDNNISKKARKYIRYSDTLKIPEFCFSIDYDINDNGVVLSNNTYYKVNSKPPIDIRVFSQIKDDKEIEKEIEQLSNNLLKIYSDLEDEFDSYVKKIYTYFQETDTINNILNEKNKEEKKKYNELQKSIDGLIKDADNKSFMDIITILVYKEFLSEKQVKNIIEISEPKNIISEITKANIC